MQLLFVTESKKGGKENSIILRHEFIAKVYTTLLANIIKKQSPARLLCVRN